MNNSKKKIYNTTIILMIIISLSAMNFLLLGSYLIVVAFLVFILFNKGVFKINSTGCLLIGLAICYIISVMLFANEIEPRIIAAPCAYLIAYNFKDDIDDESAKNILLIIAISMALHSLISFIYNIYVNGFDVFYTGISYDFWSKQISSATGIASYYYLMIATIPILFSRTNSKFKIFHIIVFLLCIVHDILIGGRTCLVLCLATLCISILIRIRYGENHKNAVKYIFAIIIFVVILIVAYWQDWFNLRSMFESSYMYRRFFSENAQEKIGNTNRWEAKKIYISNIFNYPFGGYHIKNDLSVGYAHDIWLDTFDAAGIISFFFMLIYTVGSVFRFFKYAKENRSNDLNVTEFYTFPIVMLMAFFVEPILSGAPIVFFMYCFMDGLISNLMTKKRKSKVMSTEVILQNELKIL